jgi:hypothetical protein
MSDFLRVVAFVLIAGVAFVLTRQLAVARDGSKSPTPAPIYLQMRLSALHMDEKQSGAEAGFPKDRPFALITDLGVHDGSATILTSVGGSASVYFSTGGGNIGGEGVPAIHAAAKHCAEVAGIESANFRATTSFPLPKEGEVFFYAVSSNGVTFAEDSQTALSSGKSELSNLYSAVQDIITEFREIDPSH